jgi:hypothetical protein
MRYRYKKAFIYITTNKQSTARVCLFVRTFFGIANEAYRQRRGLSTGNGKGAKGRAIGCFRSVVTRDKSVAITLIHANFCLRQESHERVTLGRPSFSNGKQPIECMLHANDWWSRTSTQPHCQTSITTSTSYHRIQMRSRSGMSNFRDPHPEQLHPLRACKTVSPAACNGVKSSFQYLQAVEKGLGVDAMVAIKLEL